MPDLWESLYSRIVGFSWSQTDTNSNFIYSYPTRKSNIKGSTRKDNHHEEVSIHEGALNYIYSLIH